MLKSEAKKKIAELVERYDQVKNSVQTKNRWRFGFNDHHWSTHAFHLQLHDSTIIENMLMTLSRCGEA